jgi:hypothetical protein
VQEYRTAAKPSYVTCNAVFFSSKRYENITRNAGGGDSTGTYTYIRTYVRGGTDILLDITITRSVSSTASPVAGTVGAGLGAVVFGTGAMRDGIGVLGSGAGSSLNQKSEEC